MPKPFAYPIDPFHVNQAWGVLDPKDYSQFGFTRHNGLDLALSPGKTIYAPCDGTVVRVGTPENGLWQPNGGGIYVGIVSDPINFPAFTNTTPDNVVVEFGAGTYPVLIDFLHCASILVKEGDTVRRGDLLAIGDNTGFSTGPHCHTQWRRIIWRGGTDYSAVDQNDANNSFDPTQFFDGSYSQPLPNVGHQAEQLAEEVSNIKEADRTAPQQESLAEQAVEKIGEELKDII